MKYIYEMHIFVLSFSKNQKKEKENKFIRKKVSKCTNKLDEL